MAFLKNRGYVISAFCSAYFFVQELICLSDHWLPTKNMTNTTLAELLINVLHLQSLGFTLHVYKSTRLTAQFNVSIHRMHYAYAIVGTRHSTVPPPGAGIICDHLSESRSSNPYVRAADESGCRFVVRMYGVWFQQRWRNVTVFN